MNGSLTLGPLLYHWKGEIWRDFYFWIADEAPVECVHLGEIVCAKRAPLIEAHMPAVLARLKAAGKEVVLSTPIMIAEARDVQLLLDVAAHDDMMVEANDVTALSLLTGRTHAVGPFVAVYNESTLARLVAGGAARVTLPFELPDQSVRTLSARGLAQLEVQVFGRWPLAISARCYHARAYGRTKDACQYACGEDPDGLPVATLDDEPFLAINGVQPQTFAYGCLVGDTEQLAAAGVKRFRLSPQTGDMVAVARIFRDVLDGRIDAEDANRSLRRLVPAPLHGRFFEPDEEQTH